MAKLSKVKLPNGTIIEISPNLSTAQITALITSLTSNNVSYTEMPEQETDQGTVFIQSRSLEQIWNSSKKDKLAIFIRSYFSDNLWFTSKEIMEQQIAITGKIVLGETSAIGTYLNRLFETGHLDKQKYLNGRTVSYKISEKLKTEYPQIPNKEFKTLLNSKL